MLPSRDPCVLANQLAGLDALDTTLLLIYRALAVTYPDAGHASRADEPADVTTARKLIEDCWRLQASLDGHRVQILVQLPTSSDVDNDDWPF